MGSDDVNLEWRRRDEFWRKHRDAHWLVLDEKTGHPLGAVYYGPDYDDHPEVAKARLKYFFALVAQEMEKRDEHEDGG